MTNTLSDRVYGCLVGGAVGDALGAPVEGWSYKRIREEYDKVDEFYPYDLSFSDGEPGMVTDDSTVRQYLALAIVSHGGCVAPGAYASVLRDHLSTDRVWVPEEMTLKKLLAGVEPRDAGRGAIPTATMTAGVTPVGVVNACRPRRAYQDGFAVASVHQGGLERGAAATVAAGIAVAMRPSASVDDVVATLLERAPDVLYRGMDLSLDIVEDVEDVDGFVERFYDELLDWRWQPVQWDSEQYREGEMFSGSSLEILPAVVGLLTLCDDAPRALVEAASFGRDADTIASLVGSVFGAVRGASALPDDLVAACESANREFFEELEGDPDADFRSMADRLVVSLERERRNARAWARLVDGL